MGPSFYLSHLARDLATGVARLPQRFRSRHAGYIASRQRSDGGFPGRSDASDLYYTAFALRALAALGVEDHAVWRRAAAYVRSVLDEPTGVVDCFSLLHAKQLLTVRGHQCWTPEEDSRTATHCEAVLRHFQARDGGWGRTERDTASLYHTFLAALSHEPLGLPLPNPKAIAGLVQARRCADSGFSDLGVTRHGETNPTAAASALLAMAGALTSDVAQPMACFLVSMQRPEGGFAAHAGAPTPDLLSTFTALVALATVDALPRADLPLAARYVQRLAARSGGFRGVEAHDQPDVEYTYYGLGAAGLLSAHAFADS